MIEETYIWHAAALLLAKHNGEATNVLSIRMVKFASEGDTERVALCGAILDAVGILRKRIPQQGWSKLYLRHTLIQRPARAA